MKIFFSSFFLYFLSLPMLTLSQETNKASLSKTQLDWFPATLLMSKSKNIQVLGNPHLVHSPYGEAVFFDGLKDAIMLDTMPLTSMDQFTIEMIFCPDTCSPFEQRVLHIGKVSGDRMLLEIRAKDGQWYFDGFVASGIHKKALIDDQLTHPLGQWAHVAFVVGPDRLTTFVNGVKECSAPFHFNPIETGMSSIGVRLNEVSWFKGMIYQIRITPKILHVEDFLIKFASK